MKLRAEVAYEESLLSVSDHNLCGHDVDPAALVALGAWTLSVLVALVLTRVPKLLDGPCLSDVVPGSSRKGLNILKDILSSPSQRLPQAVLHPGDCKHGLDPR